MECHAEGNPIPHYQWRKEGRRISNSQKYVLQGNTLTVRNVQHGDSGRYDCIAQNLAGRSVKSVNVQVQGKLHSVVVLEMEYSADLEDGLSHT